MSGIEAGQARPTTDADEQACGRIAFAVAVGLPLAWVVADRTLNLWFEALIACGDLGTFAGVDRLVAMVWMVPAMWAGWSIPIRLGRRHVLLGIMVGLLVILAISLVWLSGTTESIEPYYDDLPCPRGVPTWWPAWLPH